MSSDYKCSNNSEIKGRQRGICFSVLVVALFVKLRATLRRRTEKRRFGIGFRALYLLQFTDILQIALHRYVQPWPWEMGQPRITTMYTNPLTAILLLLSI